ncbi:MAG: dienelactone hydrolase family protein [Cyanobacteria bacterium]|nr:dienelactone hydrolase family protein [Cyanobacteriota bacterium]
MASSLSRHCWSACRQAVALICLSLCVLASGTVCGGGLYARESGGAARETTVKTFGFKTDSREFGYEGALIPYKIAIWYPSPDRASSDYYQIGPSRISTDAAFDGAVAKGKFPVVFYAHGATGAGTSSFFLCETLARAGYIVVAPDFLDTLAVARIQERVEYDSLTRMRFYQYIYWLRNYGLDKAASLGRVQFTYRLDQLKSTIDYMLSLNDKKESVFYQHLDTDRIGLVGHSFGAWTSLLLAGASLQFHDERIKAVAALSGPVNDNVYAVVSDNDLARVHTPVLFEYGEKEKDFGRADDKTLLYDKANSPKILIRIVNADHFAFSGGVKGEFPNAESYIEQDSARRTISTTTRDFFDLFLKKDETARKRLKQPGDGASLIDASIE